jgi:hypothetical protein
MVCGRGGNFFRAGGGAAIETANGFPLAAVNGRRTALASGSMLVAFDGPCAITKSVNNSAILLVIEKTMKIEHP